MNRVFKKNLDSGFTRENDIFESFLHCYFKYKKIVVYIFNITESFYLLF